MENQTIKLSENIKRIIELQSQENQKLIKSFGDFDARQVKSLNDFLYNRTSKLLIDILADFQQEFIKKTIVNLSEVMAMNYKTLEVQWSEKKI